jgi:limonene-1,2-epoxide hydrolase
MRFAAILALAAVLTACGGHGPASPGAVARAWSAALDRDDNEAAAKLFATDAEIVQNGELVLHSHGDAVAWNGLLPCGGHIERVVAQGKAQVLVVFRLVQRPHHSCDAPGVDAAAIFQVRHGKITLWHQTDVPKPPAAQVA